MFKKIGQVLKNEGIGGLINKTKEVHQLKFTGVILHDDKKTPFFVRKFRYVYVNIRSEDPHKISLYWYANNQLYETERFCIQKGIAIYEFDLAFIKAKAYGRQEKSSYFHYGRINNFGLRCDGKIVVEWSKFHFEKLTFKKDSAPLMAITEYPLIIHLELTRRCNLNCYMCRENRADDLKKIGMIDLDVKNFYKMVPFMRNAGHIAFFGWGEPLCHPNFKEFLETIGQIKESNRLRLTTNGQDVKPYTNFTTNGYLLNEDLIRSIIRNGIDEIVFSIDSPHEDGYNFIRKGSEFKRVIANLRKVQELKAAHNSKNPAITIEFVAMRRNIEELPAMVRLAAELNVKNMIVTFIVVSTKGLEQEALYNVQDLANSKFAEAESIAKENGITIILPDRFGTKPSPQGYCNDPWDTFYVRAEGTVIPCCVATNGVIGDLNKETPEDIWTSNRKRHFMDNLMKKNLVGNCKTCHKFTGNDVNLRSTHIKISHFN